MDRTGGDVISLDTAVSAYHARHLRELLTTEISGALCMPEPLVRHLKSIPLPKLVAIALAARTADEVFPESRDTNSPENPDTAVEPAIYASEEEGRALCRAFAQIPDGAVRASIVSLTAAIAGCY